MSSSSSESLSEDEKKVIKKPKKVEKKKPEKRARNDSSGDETPAPAQKKKNLTTTIEGEEVFEIGSMRYVNVRSFKGRTFVDIREYYVDKGDGKIKPGKKGISLSVEQFQNLKSIMDDIQTKLK